MHGPRHGIEVDNGSAALQGMERTKGAIERSCVIGIVLQRQKIASGALHEFAGLQEELFEELVHPLFPDKRELNSTNTSWLTGLVR